MGAAAPPPPAQDPKNKNNTIIKIFLGTPLEHTRGWPYQLW